MIKHKYVPISLGKKQYKATNSAHSAVYVYCDGVCCSGCGAGVSASRSALPGRSISVARWVEGYVPSSPPCGLPARHSTCCSAYAWPCCNILTDSCPCECLMCAKARLARSTDALCRARRKRRGWIRARIPMGRTTSNRSKHVAAAALWSHRFANERPNRFTSGQTGRSAVRASAAQTAAQ